MIIMFPGKLNQETPLIIFYRRMDISKRLKMLLPDGSIPIVTEKKDYKSNIMIIKCPDDLRSSSDPEFHMAIVDRSTVGTNYSGNVILDKLCSGLSKVKLPTDLKPGSPPPPKKYTGVQKELYSYRRGNRFNSGGRARSHRYKPRMERNDKFWAERNDKSWTERNDKSWTERNDKSWTERNAWTERTDKAWTERIDKAWIERTDKARTERTDKAWTERSKRSNVAEISPWEEGKQPWNNTLGNIHVPIFGDSLPRGIDYNEVVSRPAPDCFVPQDIPLPPHTPGVFCRDPSPSYPKGKGLLGDHPFEKDPGHSYRNHNATDDPSNNTFPSVSRVGNDYRNSRGRGSFQKNNSFKRKPFVRGMLPPNDDRNSEARIWNANAGARCNNTKQRKNQNRRGNAFNRGRPNYGPKKKY